MAVDLLLSVGDIQIVGKELGFIDSPKDGLHGGRGCLDTVRQPTCNALLLAGDAH